MNNNSAPGGNLITEERLVFLDNLRESGVINMFEAAPSLQRALSLSLEDANIILLHWMKSYGARHFGGSDRD